MQITISILSLDAEREVINGFDIRIAGVPLIGTDKQVAWAEKIRTDAIQDFVRTFAVDRAKVGEAWLKTVSFRSAAVDEVVAKLNEGCAKLATQLAAKTSAAAWIDAVSSTGRGTLLTVQALLKA